MGKEVLVLKCKKCKNDFLYEWSGRGRKPDYCPTYRKQTDYEQHLASKEKWKTKKANLTLQLAEVQKEKQTTASDDKYQEFVDRIAKLLSDLDTIRVDLCSVATELNQYQSEYDKNDQYYMHYLEDIDINNTQAAQEFLKQWKGSRNNRRSVKDLLIVVSNTIDAIPYKNLTNALPILKKDNGIRRVIYDTRRTNL